MITRGCFTASVFKIHFQKKKKKPLILDFFDANSAYSSPNKTIFSSDFGLMCCTRFVIILRRKLQNSTYLITKTMLIQLVLSRECGTGESKEKKSFLKLFYIGESIVLKIEKICLNLNERLN